MYIENEANTTKTRRVYEECKLQIIYLAKDVLTTDQSREAGEEYPGDLWG